MRNALPDRKRSAIRREAEYVLIDDAYGKVWDAGAGPDPDDELILTEIGHAFGSRIPAEAVKPAVSLTRGEERGWSRNVRHVSQRWRPTTSHSGAWTRAESALSRSSVSNANTQPLLHHAARAVRANHVLGLDDSAGPAASSRSCRQAGGWPDQRSI